MIENSLKGTLQANPQRVIDWVNRRLHQENYQGKRIVLIIPDATRSAPIGLMFKAIYDAIGDCVKNLDILVALGTHPPMSEAAICERLEISTKQRNEDYQKVGFYNHEWDNPKSLRKIGIITREEIRHYPKGFLIWKWRLRLTQGFTIMTR